MAFTCPNKNNKEWRQLVSKIGYKQAMVEYIRKGDIPNPDSYSRRSYTEKKNFIKEDISTMRKWFEDRFDGESFKVVKNLIDGDSFGQFYNGLVTLHENAEQGTGYHEAFHKVTQLYLTQKQRQSLYNEVRSKVKWMDDIAAEEYLAEDFRQYMLNGQNNIFGRPKATNIFSKIWRSIKNFILGTVDVQTVYERLSSERGYSGKKKVNSPNMSKLNRIAGFNEHDSRLILGDLTSLFFAALTQREGMTPGQFMELKKDEQKKIVGRAYASIRQLYENANKSYASQLDSLDPRTSAHKSLTEFKDVMDKVLKDYDVVIAKHAEHLRQYGVKITRAENKIEKDEDVEGGDDYAETLDGDDSTSVEVGDDGNPYTPKNEVNTVEFLSSNTKLLIASAIEMKLVPVKDSNTYKAVPVTNKLGRNTTVNFKDTYNLISYTLKGLTTEEEMWKALDKAAKTNPSLIGIMSRLGNPSSIPTSDIHKASMWRDFRVDFSKTYSEGTTTMVDPNTGTIYQISNNQQNIRERIKEKFRSNLLTSDNTSEVNGVLALDKSVANEKDPIKLLKSIGMEFEGYTDKEAENVLSPLFPAGLDMFIADLRKTIVEYKGPIDDIYNESKHSDDFNRIIDAISDRTKSVVELSYRNAEGKRIYAITQHNYLSLVVDALNQSSTINEFKKKHPHLFNIYNENSVWLNSIFPKNNEGVRVKAKDVKINLTTVSGLKQVKGDGVGTTSLHVVDKVAQEINDLLRNGSTSLPRASDKSTEYAINVTYPGKKYLIESLSKDKDKMMDIFMGYFNDELNRIVALRVDGKGKDIKVYSDKAKNFSIFEGILKKDTLKILEESGAFKGDGLYDDDLSGTPKKLVKRDIQDFINQELLSKEVASIKKLGIGQHWSKEVWLDGKKTIVEGRYGLSKELLKDNTDAEVNNLLGLFVVNHFIETIEHHKVLIGDPALFKDKFKRISAFTGNKDFVGTGLLTEWINNNREFGEYKDSDNMKVSVVKDVKMVSNMLSTYSDILGTDERLSDYGVGDKRMEIADAQGLIDIIAYKRLAFKAKRWTSTQEMQYKYEMLWEKKHWNKEKLSEEEQAILDAGEQGVFPILKAQHAGPQAYDGDLNLQAFHKYSLAPIFPRLVDGTHMADKLKQMRAKEVGYIVFDSGSKVGTKIGKDGSQHDFYESKEFADDHIQTLNNQYLGIQVDITPKAKEKVVFGTQPRKLFWSNAFENGVGKVEGFDTLHKEYKKHIDTLVNNEWSKLQKELDIKVDATGVKSINKKKLAEIIRDEAISRNLSDNVIESVQTVDTGSEVILKYQLDSLVNRNKIESLLLSLVNSRVIRQTMPGDALVQMSTAGFAKKEFAEKGVLKTYRKQVNKFKGVWKRAEVAKDTNSVYLFGDNTNDRVNTKHVPSSTQAVIRGLENTIGIDTKKDRGTGNDSYLTDADFDTFKAHVDEQLGRARELMKQGKEIVIPADGIGTGKAKLAEKAPKLAEYLNAELKKLENDSPTLPAQIKVSLNAQYLPLLDIYGGLDGVNQAIREGRIDKRILRMIGYRIPTQGMNSIENMEIIEFLPPSTMNTIILPAEIVAKSGGDFDIDKLNIFRPNFRVKRLKHVNEIITKQNELLSEDPEYTSKDLLESEEQLDELIEGEGEDGFYTSAANSIKDKSLEYIELGKGKDKKGIQNRIIEITSEIISHPHNFEMLITPNTVDTLKGIVDNIRDAKGISNTPPNQTDQLKFSHIMDQFKYFLGGKDGVPAAAIHNTFHTLFQQAGTAIDVPVWMNVNQHNGKVSLGAIKDVNDKYYISDIISQFINAYVDVAKDPFYKDLNAGAEGQSIYFYLIHMGADINTISYFMAQPGIIEITEADSMNSNILNEAYGKNKKRYEVVEDVLNKYVAQYNKLATQEGLPVLGKKEDWGQLFRQLDNDTLIKHMKKGFNKGEVVDVSKVNDIDYVLGQIQYISNFETYKKAADELSKLTRTLNYDTAKMKDLAAIEMHSDVAKEIGGEGSIFTIQDRRDILEASIVGSFDIHDKIQDIYSPLFLTESKEFKSARKKMIAQINPATSDDKAKLYSLINNDFINYLTQKYYREGNSHLYQQIEQLFKGENAVARRLGSIKNVVGDNYLLEQLQSLLSPDVNEINNITIFAKKYTVDESNSLTVSFRELLDHKEPIVVDFAKDLVKHGIIQSGLNNSPITYLGLIPHEEYGKITNVAVEAYNESSVQSKESLYNDFFIRFLLKNIDKSFAVPFAKQNSNGEVRKDLLKHVAVTRTVNNKNVIYFRGKDSEGKPAWVAHYKIPAFENLDLKRYGHKLQNFYLSDINNVGFKLISPTAPTTPSNNDTGLGEKVIDGVYVKQNALSRDEQLELFSMIKPYLESQAAKTNKGDSANKMIGLGLRWDYITNNRGRKAVNIPDPINPANKTKYAYYTEAINGEPLGKIPSRLKELISKASGIDISDYDGAIINLYDNDTFISDHNDVDESKSAINYPVVAVNIGGSGNFYIDRRKKGPTLLKAGTSYVFGVEGVNRTEWHRTYPSKQDGFLPSITTKLDGVTYPEGGYRVSITMRRVMPLNDGIPKTPKRLTEKVVADNTPPTSMGDFTNHSGGAEGADAMFDIIGRGFGVTKHNHYREPASERNKSNPGDVDSKALRDSGVKSVDLEEDVFPGVYTEGQKKATEAARQMGRIADTHQSRSNYIIRNWAQVKYADSIYAIGTIIEKGTELANGKVAKITQVKGGTGYAIQMAINEKKPVYVYDGTKNSWFSYDYATSNYVIYKGTPDLTKNFAGIGSRGTDANGEQAIKDLYAKAASKFIKSKEEVIPTNLDMFGNPKTEVKLNINPNASTSEIVDDMLKDGVSAERITAFFRIMESSFDNYDNKKLKSQADETISAIHRGIASKYSNNYDDDFPTYSDFLNLFRKGQEDGFYKNTKDFQQHMESIFSDAVSSAETPPWDTDEVAPTKSVTKDIQFSNPAPELPKGKEISVPAGSKDTNLPIFETEEKVFLMNDGQQEAYTFVKERVKEMLINGPAYHVEDFKDTLTFEDGLAKQYSGLFPKIMWDKMIGLGGRGGTGKTTVIKKIIEDVKKDIRKSNKYASVQVKYIAPTHTAATILQESLGIDSESTAGDVYTAASFSKRSKPNGKGGLDLIDEHSYIQAKKFDAKYSDVDILVFDESSMYSREQINDIILRLEQEYRANNFDHENQVYYENRAPMKMPVMIFMGDYRQLGPVDPSVNKGDLVNKGPIAASLLVNGEKARELTQVMRSDDALLHKIFDSVGNNVIHNMDKVKSGEAPDKLSLAAYDNLTNKSTENILVVNDTRGVIDDYTDYLKDNNNPYGMFWVHYNKLKNPITVDLYKKIRNTYFTKLLKEGLVTREDLVIPKTEHRGYFKYDYVQYTDGIEIPTVQVTAPEGAYYGDRLKELYGSSTKVEPGVLKPQSRYKVMDIYETTKTLSPMLPKAVWPYLEGDFEFTAEISILYNRQDRLRGLVIPLDLEVTDTYVEQGKSKGRLVTFTNKRTGKSTSMNLPYRLYKEYKMDEVLAQFGAKASIGLKFEPAYIGSSHTAQGNSIKNVIVGDYNIKENLSKGINQDDGFSSLYTALTRTSGRLVIIKNTDITNNQQVFKGFINDKVNNIKPAVNTSNPVAERIESIKSVGGEVPTSLSQESDSEEGNVTDGLVPTDNNTSDFNFSEPINIYSGDKNGYEGLSNLNHGPVVLNIQGKDVTFKTVEHLYQYYKANVSGDRVAASKIYNAPNGYTAWKEGQAVKLDKTKWTPGLAAKYLEASMRKAFEQNEVSRELLRSTGDASLTHKKDGKDMGSEFVNILTRIRAELPATSTSVVGTPKANIPQNLVSGISAYGTLQHAKPEIKAVLGDSPHSIDMIEKGFRTRTTRSADEMVKYGIKVGDTIQHFGKSASGTTKNVLAVVTAIHPKGTPGFLGTWNKEGWTEEGKSYIERLKDGAAAIEFKVVTKPKESGSMSDETKKMFNAFYTYLKNTYGADKVSGDAYREAVFGGTEAGMTPKQIKESVEEKIINCGKL